MSDEQLGTGRPSEGGSEPVVEHRAEVPRGGRSVAQTIVIVLVVLVLVAAVLWIAIPFGGG